MTARVNTLTAATTASRGHGPQAWAELRNRNELDFLLKQSFVEGVSWPIDRASLRTLLQMGSRLCRSRSISRSCRSRFKRCFTLTARVRRVSTESPISIHRTRAVFGRGVELRAVADAEARPISRLAADAAMIRTKARSWASSSPHVAAILSARWRVTPILAG